MKRSFLFVLFALLASCGGASETTGTDDATTTATAENGTEATSGGERDWPEWEHMPRAQRAEYMHDVVVPRMRTLFQEHDPERFAEFGCATCHGENARDVGFHMPNTLHPLNPEQIGGLFEAEETRDIAQFMAGPVEHTMAELLGEEPYDPETGSGFGCMSCHATASAE